MLTLTHQLTTPVFLQPAPTGAADTGGRIVARLQAGGGEVLVSGSHSIWVSFLRSWSPVLHSTVGVPSAFMVSLLHRPSSTKSQLTLDSCRTRHTGLINLSSSSAQLTMDSPNDTKLSNWHCTHQLTLDPATDTTLTDYYRTHQLTMDVPA